jgi:hypothetical protein
MGMNRRGFLKALLSVPVIAAAASVPSVGAWGAPVDSVSVVPVTRPAYVPVDVTVMFRIDLMAWQLYAQRGGHSVSDLYDGHDWQTRKDEIMQAFRVKAEKMLPRVTRGLS